MIRTAWMAPLLFLGLVQVAWAQNDRIRFQDSSKQDARCDIIDMTWKKVSYYLIVGGTQVRQDRSTRDIREIVIGDNSKQFDFKSAENLMNNGRYSDAVAKFEKARKNSRCGLALRQTARMNILLCYYYEGRYDDAVRAAEDFRRENADTYFLAETYRLQYDSYKAKSPPDLRQMARTAQEFSRAADAKNPDWKRPAGIMQAGLFEFQKEWKRALAVYGNSSYQNNLAVGAAAKLGELRCLAALQNWGKLKTRATAILRDMKNRKPEETLLMGANIALGDVELSAGNAKEAIYHYLRAALQLRTSGDPSREHETALGKASVACSRHAARLEEEEKKAEYRGIAGQLIGELSRTYPGSGMIAVAEKELGKVR